MGMLSGSWPGSHASQCYISDMRLTWVRMGSSHFKSNVSHKNLTNDIGPCIADQLDMQTTLSHAYQWLRKRKSGPYQSVFHILTCKCASRHSGVPFFQIVTSKIRPALRCFAYFDLQNVLRATAACHFSFLCWTDTSAPAALASLLFEHPEPRIIEKTQRFATF